MLEEQLGATDVVGAFAYWGPTTVDLYTVQLYWIYYRCTVVDSTDTTSKR